MGEWTLYYVRADDDDGENRDLYVWAQYPDDAKDDFRRYWKDTGFYIPKIQWIDEVPIKPDVGVVPWHDIKRHE